ncbi:MAG: type II toxin-antitoxin system HigB family toxin [Bacteroidetes bacterium]|nr:type II toxin-antitoxin system HigB family toxin [Bacteroidota bacterium]
MRIIAKRTLREFWEKHADCRPDLEDWYSIACTSDWASPHEVKKTFPKASVVGNSRVVFNICGNKYRFVVKFAYKTRIGFIRFMGKHNEYDKINVEKI